MKARGVKRLSAFLLYPVLPIHNSGPELFYITRKQLMCKMHGENSLKLAWAGDTSSGSFD